MLLKIAWQGVNHVITMDLHASQIQGVFPPLKYECVQVPDLGRLLQYTGQTQHLEHRTLTDYSA